MRLPSLLCSLFLCTVATAQTYTINGKVEDVQGTQNQFFLDGTTIPVVSTALNLNLLQGQQSLLDVVNVGTPAAPVLRVDAATPTAKVMDMGNLRLGQTSTFEVLAPAGSAAFMFLDFTSNTGFTPIPGFGGAWLMGFLPYLHAGGITNAAGAFQAPFAMPNLPQLVGMGITTQALVVTQGAWSFSNVDQKDIEP